jgi:hypothetical protein
MPTESDRDDLARIIQTVTKDAHWQTWDQTSDGIRAWCRAKADEAMAAGWRKVGAGVVVVSRGDLQALLTAYCDPNIDEWPEEEGDIAERVAAALADPAGANGGE